MGRGRGGRGGRRGGGGRGRGSGRPMVNRKEARHLQMFGEQHPSNEMGDFGGGPPPSKRLRGSRGRGKGQRAAYHGHGRGYQQGQGASRDEHRREQSSEESEEEEATPYNELLSLFKKKNKKGGEAEDVQILSDEDEESESEDENDVVKEEETVEDEESDEEGDNDDGSSDDEETVKKGIGKPAKSNETEGADEDVEQDLTDLPEEVVIDEAEINSDMEEESETSTSFDPFLSHFEREMPEMLLNRLKETEGKPSKVQSSTTWPEIDKFSYHGLDCEELNEQIEKDRKLQSSSINLDAIGGLKPVLLPNPPAKINIKTVCLEGCGVKSQLQSTFANVNQNVLHQEDCSEPMTSLQKVICQLASQYFDGYFPNRTLVNEEAIRNIYCLHAANHIMKTRTRILHHNAKMKDRVDVPDAYRDQGFVRPKVLILVPFKDSALKIVNTLISTLLPDEKGSVANKKRFVDEYSGTTLFLPKTNPKPDDYNATFGGNIEDNFKIGMSLTKKSIKLYTGFYSSDIIVASPLGLRLIIGAEGEKDRDYDFLSSIELVIMDQADIFLMQNWDHLLHVMKHLNLQPATTHGTDFARIRPWGLDGLTKYFRQTLIFSSVFCPEHCSLLTKYCQNYAGHIRLVKQFIRGSINDVTAQIPQIFQYFEASSLRNVDDERFEFFVKTVLPNYTDKLMSHTFIFVSSYFDFVRLRNYFKREQSSFVQICEYTKDKKIARARDYFFHGKSHFMLYTERAHFFRRFRLKGVGHILFYQLPSYPHFYPELCNSIQESNQNRRVRLRKNASVGTMYCKYDMSRLAAIVGTDRASQILSSEKNVHAFVGGQL